MKNNFIVLLSVGLITAFFTFLLNRLSEKHMELGYLVDGSVHLDQQTFPIILGREGDKFLFYVRLWNSGDLPIKNVPVLFVFDTDNKEFEVLEISYDTEPKHLFGNIKKQEIDARSWQFKYELLNPGDKVFLAFLTSHDSSKPKVYARAEGLTVKEYRLYQRVTAFLSFKTVIFALIVSILTLLLKWLIDNKRFIHWFTLSFKKK